MGRQPIQDEFTALNISRQQRWNLRNPGKVAGYKHRWKTWDKGKESNRRYRENRQPVEKGIDQFWHS